MFSKVNQLARMGLLPVVMMKFTGIIYTFPLIYIEIINRIPREIVRILSDNNNRCSPLPVGILLKNRRAHAHIRLQNKCS